MFSTGNTGLGKTTIDQLANHNPSRIYLAARTPSKGQSAVADVKKAVPTANVKYLPLDLASFESIAFAVKDFKAKSHRLDLLINNAGVMAIPPGRTTEGYEIQFGTNHVGHALLTKLLLPTLLSTAEKPGSDVRIVNLTSEGHKFAPISSGLRLDKETLDEEGTWARYGRSKLANILYTQGLAEHYPNITSVAVYPGLVKTDLFGPYSNASMLGRIIVMFSNPLMKTAATGAHVQLWAATTKKEELISGAYYTSIGTRSDGSAYAQDNILYKELWEWTERELSSKGY